MREGILEVSEVAGDRVIELRDINELHGVGLITCEVGGIVQGDEGPDRGVAQVFLSWSHRRSRTSRRRTGRGSGKAEVEGEVEKLRDNRTSWMAWRWNEKCERA